MSKLKSSLDDNVLRSQLPNIIDSTNDVTIKLTAERLLAFPPIKQKALWAVALGYSKIKLVADEIGEERRKTSKYLNKLAEEDKILDCFEDKKEQSKTHPSKIYFIVDEKVKALLDSVAMEGEPNESSSTSQMKILVEEVTNTDTDSKKIDVAPSENKFISIEDIQHFYQKVPTLPSTNQKIISLLDPIGRTAKAFSEQIGCDKTTANKYLKQHWDLGIAHRTQIPSSNTGRGRGEFLYFLNPSISPEIKNQYLHSAQGNCEMNTLQETQDICSTNIDSAESQNIQASYSDKVCELLDTTEKFEQIVKEMVSIQGNEAKKIISKMISKIQSHSE